MKRLQVLAVLIVVPFLTFADSSGKQLQRFFDGSGRHSALPVVDLSAPEAAFLVPLAVPGAALPAPVLAPKSIPPLPPVVSSPDSSESVDPNDLAETIREMLLLRDQNDAENQELAGAVVGLADFLRQVYVRDVNGKELRDGALQGMLQALDPHSHLFNPKEWKDFKISLQGSLGGIGATLMKQGRDGPVLVKFPIPNGPASHAGINAGDLILKINDEKTDGMNLDEAVTKIRGDPGTSVTLTVRSTGGDKLGAPRQVVIKRAQVTTPNIYFAMVAPSVGYIAIQTFDSNCAQEFKKALDKLNGQGMKKLVIDLRDDPGGSVDQVVKIAGYFLKAGQTVITMKGQHASESHITEADGVYTNLPVVVLINEGSASASEILGGALQDTKRAKLVGSHSYGKGSVQTMRENIPEPGYAIKYTIARYYLPSGRGIEGEKSGEGGLTPDVPVEITFKEAADVSEYKYACLMGQKPAKSVTDKVLEKALEALRVAPPSSK